MKVTEEGKAALRMMLEVNKEKRIVFNGTALSRPQQQQESTEKPIPGGPAAAPDDSDESEGPPNLVDSSSDDHKDAKKVVPKVQWHEEDTDSEEELRNRMRDKWPSSRQDEAFYEFVLRERDKRLQKQDIQDEI